MTYRVKDMDPFCLVFSVLIVSISINMYIKNENIRNRIMDFYRKYAMNDQHISEMNNTGGEMFTRSIYQIIILIIQLLLKKEQMLILQ